MGEESELAVNVRECIGHLESDIGKTEALSHVCRIISNKSMWVGEAELTEEENKLDKPQRDQILKKRIAEQRQKGAILRTFGENVRGHMQVSQAAQVLLPPILEDYVQENWGDVPDELKDLADYKPTFIAKLGLPPVEEENQTDDEEFTIVNANVARKLLALLSKETETLLRQIINTIVILSTEGRRNKTFVFDKAQAVKRAAKELEKRGFQVKQVNRKDNKTHLECTW